MGKFCGNVGYAIEQEISPGEWVTVITEKKYYGDVLSRNYSYQQNSESVNDNVNLRTRISVVKDSFADHNIGYVKYVVYKNARWKIEGIDDHEPPRLIYELGGLYNGPIPEEN